METEFELLLTGLNCPHCARKIEPNVIVSEKSSERNDSENNNSSNNTKIYILRFIFCF